MASAHAKGATAKELELERKCIVERARLGVLNFTRYTKPDYEINWHHRHIAQFLNRVASGEITRLMINIQPRAGKSELVSRRFPAFYLGQNPDHHMISASYSATLAARMNRDVQRIIDTPAYHDVFPGTTLSASNVRTTAQGSWLRNADEFEVVGRKGIYRSAGVGGATTGYGAHLGIIDDPVKNRDEANSAVYRDKVWDWYTSTFFTRLEKGGKIVLCMCMTGDTPVLMADGTEKPLADIRPGAQVATYEEGELSTAPVLNWVNQGLDYVYRIKTSSGIEVKANARHPFLVCREGALLWVRLKDLRATDKMMRATGRIPASPAPLTGAKSQPSAKLCACFTTAEPGGPRGFGRHPLTPRSDGNTSSNIATASLTTPTTKSSPSSEASALYAGAHPCQASTCRPTGKGAFASTTATKPASSAACSVTTATSSSGTPAPKRCWSEQSFICEPIAEIEGVGYEDVFDIQVGRTENFIANGLATHNTRWHEDDLAGRLLRKARENPDVDQWTVITFPSVHEGETTEYDPRSKGEPLWPNKYSLRRLNAMRETMGERDWVSLYQQRPAPAEGNVIKKGWWKFWTELPEEIELLVASADLSMKDNERNDFTVITVWARSGNKFYLLDMVRDRMGWPSQKRALQRVLRQYPDLNAIYIEEAANGVALVEEARESVPGVVPVIARGSKLTRLEAVSGLIESGCVFLPDPNMGANYKFTELVVSEISVFPNGTNDDIVDSMTMALAQMRSRLIDFDFEPEAIEKHAFARGLSPAR